MIRGNIIPVLLSAYLATQTIAVWTKRKLNSSLRVELKFQRIIITMWEACFFMQETSQNIVFIAAFHCCRYSKHLLHNQ